MFFLKCGWFTGLTKQESKKTCEQQLPPLADDPDQNADDRNPIVYRDYKLLSVEGTNNSLPCSKRFDIFRANKLVISIPNPNENGPDSPRYESMNLLCSLRDAHYQIPNEFVEDRNVLEEPTSANEPIKDLTGDGIPDVVVVGIIPAYHERFDYLVYSLGDKPQLFDVLNGGLGGFKFADLDRDGKYEAIGNDDTFAYWSTSFAESPFPEIILTPGHKGFECAIDLMKLPPPNKSNLGKMAAECKKMALQSVEAGAHGANTFCPVPLVWSRMLALIYSGNSAKAWRFLDLFWPSGMRCCGIEDFDDPEQKGASKEEFRRAFVRRLATSHFFKHVLALNPGDMILTDAAKSRTPPVR
jgi:hypothetical protein